MSMTRVFVYGTLKPGGRYHDEFCARYLVEGVAAIAPGLLYDFPQLGYPGMTMGNGWVHGYLLSFSSEAVLTGLDWLEDYDPQATLDKNEYRRQPTPVFTPDRHPL
ncbi:MAG: gamma-glutamylcyclotransferase family protein, partial [Cyanobacteria bacterium P01_A01_bin.105]